MSRARDALETIEVDDQSTAPTKVLSTYGGIDTSTQNYFFHVVFIASVLLLIVSLPLAFIYVPALSPISDYKIDRGDKCWVSNNTVCENHLRVEIYLWNITNPAQVLSGTQPPALQEVGPYVMTNGTTKRQNINFSEDDKQVSFVSTLYADVDVDGFCESCTLSDEIVSFNLAYAGLIKAAGSEMNLLVTSLPQTLEGLVDGISTLFAGIASNPSLASFYPNLVTALSSGPEALRALALEQIFTAGPLGGMSVTDLASIGVPSSFLEAFPTAPEYASWASTQSGLQISAIQIDSPTSDALYDAVVADSTGLTAAGILQMDATTLAAAFSLPGPIASLWKGYLSYIVGSYASAAFTKALGPALGPESSGILIKRSVQEWIFGYTDPLISPSFPEGDSRRLIRSVTKIRNASTVDEDHVPWSVTDTSLWALDYGSTPYHIATGVGAPENATNIVKSSDGSESITYPDTAHVERVVGKEITAGQYHSIKTNGLSTDAIAWADFGGGLDLKRSLLLRHVPDNAVRKNDKVLVETYAIAHENFLSCPVNKTSCGRNTKYHGTFNVSGFTLLDSVYTLPHGHRADPRVFGGYAEASDSPFSPNATRHEAKWFIYAPTGNTFGMSVPIQQNFKIEPTDTFFATLWTGTADGGGFYAPISWSALSYDMPEDFYKSIRDTVNHIELLVATWTYICPAICLMGILFSGIHLYIRRTLNRRLMDQSRYEVEAVRSDSKAIGSFCDKSLVSTLKKQSKDAFPRSRDRADVAPAVVEEV